MNQISKPFMQLLALVSCLLFTQLSFGQGTISGKITDTGDNPVIGATIIVKNASIGALSSADGSFSIKVPAGEQSIVVSFIGYQTLTQMVIVVDGQGNQLNFTLVEDALGLDEVVITGSFSERTQKNSPISMTTLNTKQLAIASFNSQADILRMDKP